MKDNKVDFTKGVKVIVSPAYNGYACGIINEEEALKKGNDSLYLCHIIAKGMIKFAIENPQDVFDFGMKQISDAKYKSSSNGEIKRFEEYDNVIDIIDLLSKKNGKLH